MKAIKKVLNNIFIDGLSGMALGLFSTLIIGTILKQIGDLTGGTYGTYLSAFAVVAQRLTGAGIGIGVAYKFRESTYVLLSAAAAGMIGAYASNLIAGTLLSDTGALVLSGPGEPLGAFVAAYVGITIGRLVAGKTKVEKLFECLDREAEFDVQTVSGWVMELFECIPKAGDFHTDEEFKLEIEVTEMSGKRIEQVRIRDLREPEEEEKE